MQVTTTTDKDGRTAIHKELGGEIKPRRLGPGYAKAIGMQCEGGIYSWVGRYIQH